ncbi:hypothetical protein CEXT_661101 [Caerostris extrusa]|uniref:Uncharacterized protein n=1 Tax=Caerostris extrusa TaxID=172846 RepID=A0AAV4NFA1_CAEEX|nr:hypothetical protein CEXT_661101 [Caerostris extrusa]
MSTFCRLSISSEMLMMSSSKKTLPEKGEWRPPAILPAWNSASSPAGCGVDRPATEVPRALRWSSGAGRRRARRFPAVDEAADRERGPSGHHHRFCRALYSYHSGWAAGTLNKSRPTANDTLNTTPCRCAVARPQSPIRSRRVPPPRPRPPGDFEPMARRGRRLCREVFADGPVLWKRVDLFQHP